MTDERVRPAGGDPPVPDTEPGGEPPAPGRDGIPAPEPDLAPARETDLAPEGTLDRDPDLGRTEATRIVAVTLVHWVRLARWPSLLLALAPVLPLLVGWGVAVSYGVGWVALAILLPVLAGAASTVLFAIRRGRYLRAVTDGDELAAQLRALLEPQLVTDEAIDLVQRVTARGGLFLLRRLKAVWKLLTFPDHLVSTLERYDRARWFVPPALGTSAMLLTAQWWTTVLSWPLCVILVLLRLTL